VGRIVYISRKEHFNAAHKLYNPNWSKEENEDVFGPCANENWHGHNFEVIITLKGEPHPDTGFVVDLRALAVLMKAEIVEKLDHKNLNLDVDFMKGKMASTENLVIEIWKIMERCLPSITEAKLHSIKLHETVNNYVEYFGEEN